MKKMSHPTRMAILIGTCILIVIAAVMTTGKAPGQVLLTLFTSSFSSPDAISDTLKRLTPLLIAGAAVFVALRCGLFNIGVEGQLMVGGITAVAVAMRFPGLPGIGLSIGAAMLAGALWAFPAGWIKAYKGGHEVISTIMLNQIAILLTSWLVAGPMIDKAAGFPTTASLPATSRIPDILTSPATFNLATLLGAICVLGIFFWSKKTISGFEFLAVGSNARAAAFAGIDAKRTTLVAMTLSGGIAGIAGGLQALAFEGRFFEGFSSGYGFDSLGVALLSGSNPLGIVLSGSLFAVLNHGATTAQVDGIPKGLSLVILSLIVAMVAAIRYSKGVAENA